MSKLRKYCFLHFEDGCGELPCDRACRRGLFWEGVQREAKVYWPGIFYLSAIAGYSSYFLSLTFKFD